LQVAKREKPQLIKRGLLMIFGFLYLTRRFQSPPEPPHLGVHPF
jgi:hypothetical protein